MDARVDFLYGVPYLLAAAYAARDEMPRLLAKPSSTVPGYRAPAAPARAAAAYVCLDLAGAANADPRDNPFGRRFEDEDARHLADLRPGQIGFQPFQRRAGLCIRATSR